MLRLAASKVEAGATQSAGSVVRLLPACAERRGRRVSLFLRPWLVGSLRQRQLLHSQWYEVSPAKLFDPGHAGA
jgi:hypothetical protein